MAPVSNLDAYEKTLIKGGPTQMFLFALHLEDSNVLQIGVGVESSNALQRAHLTGPLVHEAHVTPFVEWVKGLDPFDGLLLCEKVEGKRHPLNSLGQTVGEYAALLAETPCLELGVGRYLPLAATVSTGRLDDFAKTIERARVKAFGHPLTWDTQHVELRDGRFIWLAYDDDIDKIRFGMGYHNAENEKQYGLHTYAVGSRDLGGFVAHHFMLLDAPMQFMGLPPRWPETCSPFLFGPLKQRVMTQLLKLGDRIWPSKIA